MEIFLARVTQKRGSRNVPIDDRIQALEDEARLIKGELKQAMVNVRDFLLGLKLPGEEDALNPEIHVHEEYNVASEAGGPGPSSGGDAPPPPETGQLPQEPGPPPSGQERPFASQEARGGVPPPQAAAFPDIPPLTQQPLEEEPASGDEGALSSPMDLGQSEQVTPDKQQEDETLSSPADYTQPEEQIPGKPQEEIRDEGAPERSKETKMSEESGQHTSQVNLLTNLIRWVSTVSSELGLERLPAFLEVYSISEPVSNELKEVILHLAKVTTPYSAKASAELTPEKPTDVNAELAATQPADTNSDSATPSESVDTEPVVARPADLTRHQPTEANADVWCRLILELHGILSMGKTPLHSMRLSLDVSEEPESPPSVTGVEGDHRDKSVKMAEESKEKGDRPKNKRTKTKVKGGKPGDARVRLRLVIPTSDGVEKEYGIEDFSINLSPEISGGSS